MGGADENPVISHLRRFVVGTDALLGGTEALVVEDRRLRAPVKEFLKLSVIFRRAGLGLLNGRERLPRSLTSEAARPTLPSS
jgi:hypothetical protein